MSETLKILQVNGYNIKIEKPSNYKEGDPLGYTFESRDGYPSGCSYRSNHPAELDEMIKYVTAEVSKYPPGIAWVAYDRENDKNLPLKELIEKQRRFIIDDFEKLGFKECSGVKWVINFPDEFCKKLKGYPSLRYYPKIKQHNGFEIWFEIHVEYHPYDKEIVIDTLKKCFKQLECKPIYHSGDMFLDIFDLQIHSYFTEEVALQIRKDHPRYGNFSMTFFINPDYPNPNDTI